MLVFLLISVVALLLVFKSPIFRVEGVSPQLILAAFVLKCLAGFALLFVYGSHLEIDRADADVFKYFDDGVVMHSSFEEGRGVYKSLFLAAKGKALDPYYQAMHNWEHASDVKVYSDNRTMIRIHSVLCFISGRDIRVHQIVFALISFLGLLFLFKGFSSWSKMSKGAFFIICILPPSLLFWASGLLKETLVLLPLGLAVYGLSGLKGDRRRVIAVLISAVLFFLIKPYIGLCLLPGAFFLLLRYLVKLRIVFSLAFTLILFGVAVLSSIVIFNVNPIDILRSEQVEFIAKAESESAGSLIELNQLNDFGSFFVQSPIAVFNTLFRPGLWEARGGLDILSAIENAGYLLLILLALFFRKKEIDWTPLFFSLLFIVTLACVIGSVTPVLGAIVRYKVPLLPFLMFALYLVVDLDKLPFKRIRIQ